MIRVELLTAPGRSKCHAAKALVATLIEKARNQVPNIQIEDIDVAGNPAVAVKYRVMATPAIAINGKLEFTAVPREDALLARLRGAADGEKGAST